MRSTPIATTANPSRRLMNRTLRMFSDASLNRFMTEAGVVMAEHAAKFLFTSEVASSRGFGVGGILLLGREMANDPLHVAVVGARSDPRTTALFKTAIQYFDQFKRIELYDHTEGPLPNADVTYPDLKNPAAFLCTGGACSAPMSDPAKLAAKLHVSMH